MDYFKINSHLSEIIEKSEKTPVIIFKYSNDCNSSSSLYEKIKNEITEKKLTFPVYLVTVQTQPVLSKNIEDWFEIKHESPQIFIINRGKVTYTAHHDKINLSNFIFT